MVSRSVELAICVAGIYACFLSWAYLQERLTSTEYVDTSAAGGAGGEKAASDAATTHKFKFFIVLNACQALACAVWAFVYLTLIHGGSLGHMTKDLASKYLAIAISSTVASPFGYASLSHINYPTHMLAKSSKLIPVMLVGIVLHRRSYPVYKYVSVALVTAGVSAFMLMLPPKKGHHGGGDTKANSWYGLGLVMVNMLLDGFTGSTQDQIFKAKRATAEQMMLYMNLFAFALLALWLLVDPLGTGELGFFLSFARASPDVLGDMGLFCLGGALGQTFVFRALGSFGSITLVTITVTRKLFTIIFSVVLYGHPTTLGQWAAVAVVFGGILIEAVQKSKDKAKEKNEAGTKETKIE